IAATRPLAGLIGLRDNDLTRWVMRGMGVREITSGVGILSRPRLAGWVWSRVGGDAVDLALLGLSLRARRNSQGRLLGAIGAVLGVAALDVYDSLRLGRRPGRRHARNKHPKSKKKMKAVCWHGTRDPRVDSVPDPTIEDPRNPFSKATSTAICGSDLRIFDGFVAPFLTAGDILGHEPMGEVVEVGSAVTRFKVG